MIMSTWARHRLGDLVETQKGFAFKSAWFSDVGRPIVKVSNFTDDSVDGASLVHIPEQIASEYLKYRLKADDVVVQTVGSWPTNPASVVGKCVRVPGNVAGALLNQNAVKLSPTNQLDGRFLFYLLRCDDFKSYIIGTAQGAASQAAITLEAIRGYEFDLPPLPVQRRIAGNLSAYDELIENSQRRIRLLEDMACALYREWFVHFRFPRDPSEALAKEDGHESVPRLPSALGDIPQGWEVRTVADSFEISGGGTPSRKEEKFWAGGTIQWFSPSDLTGAATMFMDDSSDHITALGLAESSARLFPARSVMLTSRATIGAIAINTHDACTNQGFITCLPNERVPLYFLFHWLKENVPTFQRMASGATFKEISRGVFKTIEFLQPPAKLVRSFENAASPMAKQALTLQRQIQNLRRTRDLLLPRLLSGSVTLDYEERS
jgi:type I restriction enzyme S subunit